MVETRSHTLYDALIIVTCRPQIQKKRLMDREEFDSQTAEKWLSNQLPLSKKEAVADFVIDNSGTREELKSEVDRAWEEICRTFELKY